MTHNKTKTNTRTSTKWQTDTTAHLHGYGSVGGYFSPRLAEGVFTVPEAIIAVTYSIQDLPGRNLVNNSLSAPFGTPSICASSSHELTAASGSYAFLQQIYVLLVVCDSTNDAGFTTRGSGHLTSQGTSVSFLWFRRHQEF